MKLPYGLAEGCWFKASFSKLRDVSHGAEIVSSSRFPGQRNFGHVAQAGLGEESVAGDLTAIGPLAGRGALGDVDLI